MTEASEDIEGHRTEKGAGRPRAESLVCLSWWLWLRRVDSNQPPSIKVCRMAVAAATAHSVLVLKKPSSVLSSLLHLCFSTFDDDHVDDDDDDDGFVVSDRLAFSSLLTSAPNEPRPFCYCCCVTKFFLSTQF